MTDDLFAADRAVGRWGATLDERLVEVFLTPVRVCSDYRPAFGLGRTGGLSYDEFGALYGADPFYNWLGLADPAVYAAHRAAGGLTSVYRQLGVGSERLFRSVLAERLGLSGPQMDWSYTYQKPGGKDGVHTLDARIRLGDLSGGPAGGFEAWLAHASGETQGRTQDARPPLGAVFEVRQGYKSADSKRQNADLRFGQRAWMAGLVPVVALMSTQVSEPVARRYRADGMLVLTGRLNGSATESTFSFFREVVGFDLAAFFERNSQTLQREVGAIVQKLLSPE